MVCFSFLEPAAKELIIPKALEKNIGVIAMKSKVSGSDTTKFFVDAAITASPAQKKFPSL